MACASLLTDDNILRFRTKACLRLAQGSCSFGDDRCQYSHSRIWMRRSPYYASPSTLQKGVAGTAAEPLLRYLPVPCDNLLVAEGEVVKVKCLRGVSCPFAHSPEEIAYHPLLYKTEPCEAFAQRSCRVYYCWRSHGERERRQCVTEMSLGLVKGIGVTINYPGVKLVELLPSKSGRKRRSRLPAQCLNDTPESELREREDVAPMHLENPDDETELLLCRLMEELADLSARDHAAPPRVGTCTKSRHTQIMERQSDGNLLSKWPPIASLLQLIGSRRGGVDVEADVRDSPGPSTTTNPLGSFVGSPPEVLKESSRRINRPGSLQEHVDLGPVGGFQTNRRATISHSSGGEAIGIIGSQSRHYLSTGTRFGSNSSGNTAHRTGGSLCFNEPTTNQHNRLPLRFPSIGDPASGGGENRFRKYCGSDENADQLTSKMWFTTSTQFPKEEAKHRVSSRASRSSSSAGGSISSAACPVLSTRASDASLPEMIINGLEEEQTKYIDSWKKMVESDRANDGSGSGRENSGDATSMNAELPLHCGSSRWNGIKTAFMNGTKGTNCGKVQLPSPWPPAQVTTAKEYYLDRGKRMIPPTSRPKQLLNNLEDDILLRRLLNDMREASHAEGGLNKDDDEDNRLTSCIVSLLKLIQDQESADLCRTALDGSDITNGSVVDGGKEGFMSLEETADPYSPHATIRELTRLAA